MLVGIDLAAHRAHRFGLARRLAAGAFLGSAPRTAVHRAGARVRAVAVRCPVAKGVPVVDRHGHLGRVARPVDGHDRLLALGRRKDKAAVLVKFDVSAVHRHGVRVRFVDRDRRRGGKGRFAVRTIAIAIDGGVRAFARDAAHLDVRQRRRRKIGIGQPLSADAVIIRVFVRIGQKPLPSGLCRHGKRVESPAVKANARRRDNQIFKGTAQHLRHSGKLTFPADPMLTTLQLEGASGRSAERRILQQDQCAAVRSGKCRGIKFCKFVHSCPVGRGRDRHDPTPAAAQSSAVIVTVPRYRSRYVSYSPCFT